MLLAIAIAFILKRYGTQAVALPVPTSTSSAFEAPILVRDDPSAGCNSRTVLDILWSCLATTFACTWVSVHPNVPFKGEGRWTILRRRVYVMFFSIFAPEFMVMWAFKQWRGAVMIKEGINDAIKAASSDKTKPVRELWTTAHGHLLQMGGFRLRATARETFFWAGSTALGSRTDRPPSVGEDDSLSDYISQVQKKFDTLSTLSGDDLCDAHLSLRSALFNSLLFYKPEEPSASETTRLSEHRTSLRDSDTILEGVLTTQTLKKLLSENLLRFPTITEDEINDRSKGDALSKGIALLQLTWFIVHIITRAAQGLVISELELTTAALAGLNSVMYIFWWSKRRDVRFPVVIRTKCVDEILSKRTEDITWSFSDSEPEFDIRRHLWISVTATIRGILDTTGRFFLSLPKAVEGALVRFYKFAKAFPRSLVIFCSRIPIYFVRTVKNTMGEKKRVRSGKSKVISEVHDVLNVDDLQKVKPEISDAEKSRMERYAKTAKTAMKFITLPFYLLVYIIDLTLFIPIAKIVSAVDDNSLSEDMSSGFNIKGVNKTYSMIFYSENAGVKPLLAASSIAGALFGAVHCLAWNFSSPSHTEQILWRAASLGVVGSCAAVFYSVLCFHIADDGYIGKTYRDVVFRMLLAVGVVLSSLASLVYPLSRITLFVLAVASLRSLPPSAFDIVDWIELVPHI